MDMNPSQDNRSYRPWKTLANILLPSVLLCIYYLVVMPGEQGHVLKLPVVMALLNAISSGLLIGAFLNIHKKRIETHKKLNLMALTTSVMFLTSYVVYHYFQVEPVRYTGDFRTLYFFILLTHIPLAVTIVPLAVVTAIRGLGGKFEKHRRIAKITLPLWLYVSVTGVIIYFMIN